MELNWIQNNIPCDFLFGGDLWAYYDVGTVEEYVSDHISLKYLIDNVSHISQCVLILAMSFERYILICHPAKAKTLYSTKRKVIFYAALSFFMVLLSVPLFVDLFAIESNPIVRSQYFAR